MDHRWIGGGPMSGGMMVNRDSTVARVPVPVWRAVAALGFVAGAVLLARAIRPEPTLARTVAVDAPLEATQTQRSTFIGTLEGREYNVDVFILPGGTRYTVRTAEGEIRAQLIDADQLHEQFPTIAGDPIKSHMADVVDDSLDEPF